MTTTAIREKPIIMQAHSVKAILAGVKTQKRRVAKDIPLTADGPFERAFAPGIGSSRGEYAFKIDGKMRVFKCPYGRVGDRLWVKETYSTSGLKKFHYTGDPDDHGGPNDPCYAYAATATYKCGKKVPDLALAMGSHKWKSSMFMPRAASRITLEIIGVKVERVQDISEDDATSEGMDGRYIRPSKTGGKFVRCSKHGAITPQDQYRCLWDEINGKAHPWESNPWVWVIEFKHLKGI